MIKLFFTRRWILTTLLAIAAIGVMARLGIWQLERLDERRGFNARVSAQIDQPPLILTGENANAALTTMEYRAVVVTGAYDFSQQVALRNQAYENHLGVHLLTPLVIADTHRAVIVNRGWIPIEQAAPANWRQFDEPGIVEVRGVIRQSQDRADFGSITDPPGFLFVWNHANIARIADQVSIPLLPIYIQQAPALENRVAGANLGSPRVYPIRSTPDLDLSEGPHFGYAMQWFLFAAVLAIGYPQFVFAQTKTQQIARRAKASRFL